MSLIQIQIVMTMLMSTCSPPLRIKYSNSRFQKLTRKGRSSKTLSKKIQRSNRRQSKMNKSPNFIRFHNNSKAQKLRSRATSSWSLICRFHRRSSPVKTILYLMTRPRQDSTRLNTKSSRCLRSWRSLKTKALPLCCSLVSVTPTTRALKWQTWRNRWISSCQRGSPATIYRSTVSIPARKNWCRSKTISSSFLTTGKIRMSWCFPLTWHL